MNDSILTIEAPTTGEFKEKGSKFFAYAYPIQSENEVNKLLSILKHEHHKARHFCYAFQIGHDGNLSRSNDDGEPSGSAGKPIHNQILSFGVSNVLVVVVRYFGGTKLGIPGLINAYKEATKNALSQASLVYKYIYNQITVSCEYSFMGQVMEAIKLCDLEITSKSFDANCSFTIQVRQSIANSKVKQLKAKALGRAESDISDDDVVPFMTIHLT